MNIFPDGKKIIYHNGWWHGSNATFIRLLAEKATIIIIGNKFTRAIYHAKILTAIFGNYYPTIDEEEAGSLKDAALLMDSLAKKDTAQILKSVKKKKKTKSN